MENGNVLEREITYNVERSKQVPKKYILWKCSKTSHGICYRNVFEGSKAECEKESLKK